MNRFSSYVVVVALGASLIADSVRAAPEAEAAAGRALVKRYADAIVSVELVLTLKLKFGDREQPPREQRIEVNGTVISPTGLTVTSLAVVDPQSQMEGIRAQLGGRGAELVGTDFKEVKLRFADGKEVPARFVLKDADLDLAFMAPETPEADRVYSHVNLGEAATGVVLGNYFFVSRQSKALQRVPVVRMTEVIGIVEKPRRFFLMTDQSLATPVLDPQGKVLGISLQHFANGRPTGLVVMPSEDIADMAKQAAAAQATAK
jgi:S1-C subfamily serine protease